MESMLTTFHEHLRRKAACYLSSEGSEIKELAMDVLNGADRGDLQEVSPVLKFG